MSEVLAIKDSRGASHRYRQAPRSRLTRLSDAFRKDACHVTTAELQAWLDDSKLAPQSRTNFRRVLHMLFAFAVARGDAIKAPGRAALGEASFRYVSALTDPQVRSLLKAGVLQLGLFEDQPAEVTVGAKRYGLRCHPQTQAPVRARRQDQADRVREPSPFARFHAEAISAG